MLSERQYNLFKRCKIILSELYYSEYLLNVLLGQFDNVINVKNYLLEILDVIEHFDNVTLMISCLLNRS